MTRVVVIGRGIAAASLVWRLAQNHAVQVVCIGMSAANAATRLSGGAIRRYERDEELRALATESYHELFASPPMREASSFRPATALLAFEPDDQDAERHADLPSEEGYEFFNHREGHDVFGLQVSANSIVVRDMQAGTIDVSGLATYLFARAAQMGAEIIETPVAGITDSQGILAACGPDGSYTGDKVVVALGAWTPGFLKSSRITAAPILIRRVRYYLFGSANLPMAHFMVDPLGVFGRPAERGTWLIGRSTNEWLDEPDTQCGCGPMSTIPCDACVETVNDCTATLTAAFPRSAPSGLLAVVNGVDSYRRRPGLSMRHTGLPNVYTYCGGSGLAAKSALAASRLAVGELLAN